jgi:hypothetical protein
MKLKSNAHVHSAATASRTGTKQGATKTQYMCVAIRGRAQLSPHTTKRFTTLLTPLAKPTPAAIVATNSHDLDVSLVLVV